MKKPMIGSYWVHKKTSKEYKVIAVGLWEETLEECVVYVSAEDLPITLDTLDKKQRCWIRPLEIFMDGRFYERPYS
jgi:hypothetical protein